MNEDTNSRNADLEVRFFGLQGWAVCLGNRAVSASFRTEEEANRRLSELEDGLRFVPSQRRRERALGADPLLP